MNLSIRVFSRLKIISDFVSYNMNQEDLLSMVGIYSKSDVNLQSCIIAVSTVREVGYHIWAQPQPMKLYYIAELTSAIGPLNKVELPSLTQVLQQSLTSCTLNKSYIMFKACLKCKVRAGPIVSLMHYCRAKLLNCVGLLLPLILQAYHDVVRPSHPYHGSWVSVPPMVSRRALRYCGQKHYHEA